jgi:hypothetical protein
MRVPVPWRPSPLTKNVTRGAAPWQCHCGSMSLLRALRVIQVATQLASVHAAVDSTYAGGCLTTPNWQSTGNLASTSPAGLLQEDSCRRATACSPAPLPVADSSLTEDDAWHMLCRLICSRERHCSSAPPTQTVRIGEVGMLTFVRGVNALAHISDSRSIVYY